MEQHPRKRFERDQFAGERRRGGSGSQRRMHRPEIEVGQEFDVTIESVGHKGDGIAKIEGFTVFVKNTEQGEQVRIKMTKVLDTVGFADRL